MSHHGRLVAIARSRPGRLPRLIALLAVAVGLVISVPPAPADAALSTWTGGINLYRTGVYTVQKTWTWCTAADVQIMRNIVRNQSDHSYASQKAYFAYMRLHNHYAIPSSDGVDPHGWAAGLKRWVDLRYRAKSYATFAAGLKVAVKSLRMTNRPIGILVARGNHAWVLHGFTATADPARTNNFTVTSVRVTGPLWGLQNRTFGYDMAPNKKLTSSQFRTFWTPWHYARIRMVWEGRFVAIVPVYS
jgi:hypothetical protein